MGNEIKLRKYRKGDEVELVRVYNEIFNSNRSLNYWNWKYKENPAGFLIVVAENNEGEIVGQYPQRFKKGIHKGKDCLFMDTLDIGIKKEYRHKGLAKKAFPFLPKVPYIDYGFTNDLSFNTSRKTFPDSSLVFDVKILSKSLFPRFLLHKISSNVNVIELKDDLSEIDKLWKKKKLEIISGVIRDSKFLKWRILNSPSKPKLFILKKNEDIFGYFSLVIRNKKAYLLDILILNDKINLDVFKIIENKCKQFGARRLFVLLNDKKLVNNILNFKYKSCERLKLMYLNNLVENENLPHYLTFADLDRF